MNFDFSGLLLDAEDEVFLEAGKAISHLKALKRAILDLPQEGHDKLAQVELFLKLREHTLETEYTSEESALLDKAALGFPTLFASQLHSLLTKHTKG
jgi:hypothetical protein